MILKIVEYIVLAGVVTFLGLVFLIEVFDLFLIRPIYQRLFKKKRRKKSRVLTKGQKSRRWSLNKTHRKYKP